jgi:hydrogenase/urease accessory protein HupE
MLYLLGLVVAARAHPILQDYWYVGVDTNRLMARYNTSLQEVAIAQRLDTNKLGRLKPDQWILAVSNHAVYLRTNLFIEAGGVTLLPEITDFQVQPDSDPGGSAAGGVESTRAWVDFEYSVTNGLPPSLRLHHLVLDGFEYGPRLPWMVTTLLVVKDAFRQELGHAVLTIREPVEIEIRHATPKAPIGASDLALEYLRVGLFHVWEGWDHLLFLIGLVLGVTRLRQLGALVLLFTFAHSITITLASFGWVRAPAAVVEPTIAASIVAVAVLNMLPGARTSPRHRYVAAGSFGLVHGLGFASGLREALGDSGGLPRGVVVAAFCVGVELAHMAVGIPAFLIFQRIRPALQNEDTPSSLTRWGSAMVAAGGAAMFVLAARHYW